MAGCEAGMKFGAILIGFMLGCIHGIVLATSVNSLGTASFILYGDATLLPLQVTAVIDSAILIGVGSSVFWLPFMMNLQERYAIKRS